MWVPKQRGKQGNPGDSGTPLTEQPEKQRLVGFKGHHAHLIVQQLDRERVSEVQTLRRALIAGVLLHYEL